MSLNVDQLQIEENLFYLKQLQNASRIRIHEDRPKNSLDFLILISTAFQEDKKEESETLEGEGPRATASSKTSPPSENDAKYVLLLNDGSLLEKLAAKQNDAGFIDLFIDPFQKMSHDQLKDIIDNDISNDFLKLETKKESLKYWENVKLVLKSLLRGGTTRHVSELSKAVESGIKEMFATKSLAELDHLRQQIETKIRTGGPSIDLDYWDIVLKDLAAHYARMELYSFFVEKLVIQISIKPEATQPSVEEVNDRDQFDAATMEPLVTKELSPSDAKYLVLDPSENVARLEEERKVAIEKWSAKRQT